MNSHMFLCGLSRVELKLFNTFYFLLNILVIILIGTERFGGFVFYLCDI